MYVYNKLASAMLCDRGWYIPATPLQLCVTVHTCCQSGCTCSSWFTQAPWVASLDSDVVLSKGVKSREDHFTIWVSHTSSYCLVCGWGCIDVVCHTNTGSSWCRCPGDLDGVWRQHLDRHTCWGYKSEWKMQNANCIRSAIQEWSATNAIWNIGTIRKHRFHL